MSSSSTIDVGHLESSDAVQEPTSPDLIEISSDEEDELNDRTMQLTSIHGSGHQYLGSIQDVSTARKHFVDLCIESRARSSPDVEFIHASKRIKVAHNNATLEDITCEDKRHDRLSPIDLESTSDLPSKLVQQTGLTLYQGAGGTTPVVLDGNQVSNCESMDHIHSSIDASPRSTNAIYRRKPRLKRPHILGKRPRQAPYYDDAKLGVRMYRGPGFEKFPVPLDDAQHRLICDLWDRKTSKKNQQYHISQATERDTIPETSRVITPDGEPQKEPEGDSDVDEGDLETVAQVIDILPDVSHQFVLDVLELMTEKLTDDIRCVPSANDVLARIMEYEVYPKERSVSSETCDTGFTIRVNQRNATRPYYQTDAIILLAEEFDFIPTYFIQRVMKEQSSLRDAFTLLYQCESAYRASTDSQRPYKRLRQPRLTIEKKYARKLNSLRDGGQWRSLIIEMQAARQHVTRVELKDKEDKERQDLETANLQQHITRGEVIECQCCFDDEVPTNRTVACSADRPHLYCFQCIERLAGNNTGGGKYEMSCMSQCGCKSQLDPDGIAKAVPTNILRKLALNQQHAEIDAADIEGLEKCPHCDFKGICEPIEIDPVFSCLDPECGRVTCRVCLEPAHSPKTCDQVKRERGLLKSRHEVEEARSLAMMRTCPRCNKKAIKESGCNKVTCTCGCMSCFVCQKDISKEMYRHFGPPPKCPQADSFDRHQQDADNAEKAMVEKIRADNPDYENAELAVDSQTTQASNVRTQMQNNAPPFRPWLGFGHQMPPIPWRNIVPPGQPNFPHNVFGLGQPMLPDWHWEPELPTNVFREAYHDFNGVVGMTNVPPQNTLPQARLDLAELDDIALWDAHMNY